MQKLHRGNKIRASGSDRAFAGVLYALTILFVLIILYPLVFVFSASISNPMEVFAGRVWLFPRDIQFEAYKQVFRNNEIFTGYRNTIVYTCLGTLVSIVLTLSAAYPLSRKKMYGRNIIMFYFTFTMFFSGGLIPTYLVVKGMGLYNNLWVMILVGSVSVYNMIVARTFMQNTISDELYEAAEIDGCSDIPAFFKVALPLCAPIIAVLVLFYAVGYWNSYFNALIYLSDRARYPLQLFLREILLINMADSMVDSMEMDMDISKFMVSESLKYAVIIVSSIPMLILYPFLQRFFVKGVMIGAIKG
ncbi:MAG: carbohydrate ABC transporter permease [Provencibacterium sp.]|jgi:putative aldouronate transport system permease protein|nr:carbohydrate ABC transporter permease [Provencibacterium sp.]